LQAANGQLVDLQDPKPRLPDCEPAYGEATDCQRADRKRDEGDGTYRKRADCGGRKGLASNRDVLRHELSPGVVAIFRQMISSRLSPVRAGGKPSIERGTIAF
jgi:hypothetical protein